MPDVPLEQVLREMGTSIGRSGAAMAMTTAAWSELTTAFSPLVAEGVEDDDAYATWYGGPSAYSWRADDVVPQV